MIAQGTGQGQQPSAQAGAIRVNRPIMGRRASANFLMRSCTTTLRLSVRRAGLALILLGMFAGSAVAPAQQATKDVANKRLTIVERRKPALTFDSRKSVKAMADCLARSLLAGTPSIVEGETATRVLVSYSDTVMVIFVVTPTAEGSHVSMHRLIALMNGKSEAAACA